MDKDERPPKLTKGVVITYMIGALFFLFVLFMFFQMRIENWF